MARPGRLELPTLCLEGRRSIQLSYGRIETARLILEHFWTIPKKNPMINSASLLRTLAAASGYARNSIQRAG